MVIEHRKKEEIERIIALLRKYKPSDLKPTQYYTMRRIQRQIPDEFVRTTFFEFGKIKYIEEEILKRGDVGYDLFYELNTERVLVIGVAMAGDKLELIHVYNGFKKWLKQSSA